MPRFFVPTENFDENTARITGDDAFHIARALRMAVGDEITVCDMKGSEHICRLSRIRDEECVCEILESRAGKTESPVEVTLYMGYPKGDKLELIIQKAVELGAVKIVPFESSRCVKRPKADKIERQMARLSRIAEEASKQCGRGVIAEVAAPVPFASALVDAAGADIALFCYEGEGALTVKEALSANKTAKTISVMIGCEGGFSIAEAEAARNAGMKSVGLGPRILRCETAPMYALSAISYEFEL